MALCQEERYCCLALLVSSYRVKPGTRPTPLHTLVLQVIKRIFDE
jgi:hypothetical protein